MDRGCGVSRTCSSQKGPVGLWPAPATRALRRRGPLIRRVAYLFFSKGSGGCGVDPAARMRHDRRARDVGDGDAGGALPAVPCRRWSRPSWRATRAGRPCAGPGLTRDTRFEKKWTVGAACRGPVLHKASVGCGGWPRDTSSEKKRTTDTACRVPILLKRVRWGAAPDAATRALRRTGPWIRRVANLFFPTAPMRHHHTPTGRTATPAIRPVERRSRTTRLVLLLGLLLRRRNLRGGADRSLG